MKVLSTTNVRKHIKEIVNRARYRGEVFAIGRRNAVDAVLIGFPQSYNGAVNDISNVNAYSRAFDFLSSEPDLYSASDLVRNGTSMCSEDSSVNALRFHDWGTETYWLYFYCRLGT